MIFFAEAICNVFEVWRRTKQRCAHQTKNRLSGEKAKEKQKKNTYEILMAI
jgi:hypothetical protein